MVGDLTYRIVNCASSSVLELNILEASLLRDKGIMPSLACVNKKINCEKNSHGLMERLMIDIPGPVVYTPLPTAKNTS